MVTRLYLAPNGPEVSRFAWGAWRLMQDPDGNAPQRIRAKIDACLELGITTFDHAEVYGGYTCEAAFGTVLREAPGLRPQMEIVSKCGIQSPAPARPENRLPHYDLSARYIVTAVERSLRNLHTDYLDVLLLHRPSPLMDPDEIAAALTQLRASGKMRFAGVSNFSPAQFDLIQARLDFQLVTNQIEVNLLSPWALFDGTIDHLMQRRIHPMAWSPTAGGRIFTSNDETAVRLRAALTTLATRLDTTAEVLTYAWLLRHPSRMQIMLGSNRVERIRAAVAAESTKLDVQDWFELLRAARGHDVP